MLTSMWNRDIPCGMESHIPFASPENSPIEFDWDELFGNVTDYTSNDKKNIADDNACSMSTSSDNNSEPGDTINTNVDQHQLCKICSDNSSGLHYGVLSCEACKAFFKRTIQGNIKYMCLSNEDCEITKKCRRSCPACRLQKCLKMGMLKEGIRLDRHRGAKLKNPTSVYALGKLHRLQKKSQLAADNSAETLLKTLMSIESESSQVSLHNEQVQIPEIFCKQSVLTSLLTFDQFPFFKNRISFLTEMASLFDKELIHLIRWARKLPAFSKLCLSDQMSLLHAAWLELLNFKFAYQSVTSCYNARSNSSHVNLIVFSDQLVVPINNSSSQDINAYYLSSNLQTHNFLPQTLISVFNVLMKKIVDLKLTIEEFLFLKAITLFNSDVDCLQNVRQITHQRALLTETLSSYKWLKDLSPSETDLISPNLFPRHQRIMNILMLLCDVRRSSLVCASFWQGLKKEGSFNIKQLLSEMIDQLVS